MTEPRLVWPAIDVDALNYPVFVNDEGEVFEAVQVGFRNDPDSYIPGNKLGMSRGA